MEERVLTTVTPLTFENGEQIGPGTTNPGGQYLASTDALAEVLYVAYFERAGDPKGTNYWANELNVGGGTIDDEAVSFSQQVESTNLYPFLANPSTANTALLFPAAPKRSSSFSSTRTLPTSLWMWSAGSEYQQRRRGQ
jgi:hypothetical protein